MDSGGQGCHRGIEAGREVERAMNPVARRAVEQAALRLGEDADIGALIKLALQEIGR